MRIASLVPGESLVGPLVPLEEAEAVLVESFADLAPGTWSRAPNLRWIVSLAAGAEHVPFELLPPGARVVSLHGPNAREIAEHAIALAIAAMKRIVEGDRALRSGRFEQTRLAMRVAGARLLVLGAGTIGREVARLGDALEMRTRVWLRGEAIEPLLAEADVVVIALPLTRETRGLLDAARLAAMKEDAVLVNVARGKIVDRDALAQHLATHPSFRYATDVWWRYPREGAAFEETLVEKENVIGTPHVAALTPGWREERVREGARVARALLATRSIPAGARLEDPADYARPTPARRG